MWLDLSFLLGGVALLYFGAEWLVGGAAGIARTYGVPPLVVGLTIVAYGTSSPELAVSALAALQGKGDIALGNVVGSNIFNSLLIIGGASTLRPLQADVEAMRFELSVMIGFSLLCGFFLRTARKVSRWEGGLLVCGYATFLAMLVVWTQATR